jgi:hypothetical protein
MDADRKSNGGDFPSEALPLPLRHNSQYYRSRSGIRENSVVQGGIVTNSATALGIHLCMHGWDRPQSIGFCHFTFVTGDPVRADPLFAVFTETSTLIQGT